MAPRKASASRTVAAYLADLPSEQRAALERVRKLILAAAPAAEEKISYGMPGFFVEGRGLVWIGAFRKHCSLFPGSIRFTPDDPIPAAEVRRVVKARLAEEKARAKKAAARKAPARTARRRKA